MTQLHVEPLLSIVTVCYNSENSIRRCIESARDCVSLETEHIIIDGNSSDNTLSILKEYSHLRIYSAPDQGIYDAMNRGILCSRGIYIMFLNSDDEIIPSAIFSVIRQLQKHHSVDIYMCECFLMADNSRIHKLWTPKFPQILPFKMPAAHMSLIYRKTVFDIVGLYNLKYRLASDFEHILRSFSCGMNFDIINQSVGKFYPGGSSSKFLFRSIFETFLIRLEYNHSLFFSTLNLLREMLIQYVFLLLSKLNRRLV